MRSVNDFYAVRSFVGQEEEPAITFFWVSNIYKVGKQTLL